MTGVLLLSSLGQQYYALLILPTFIGIFHALFGPSDAQGDAPRSLVFNAPAGLAATMFYFSLNWFMDDYAVGSLLWIQVMAWIGWMLLCLTMFAVLIKWTIEEHAAGYDWLGRAGATSFFGSRGTSRAQSVVASDDRHGTRPADAGRTKRTHA